MEWEVAWGPEDAGANPPFRHLTGRTVNGAARFISGIRLLPEHPEQQRQHYRNDDARGDGKVEAVSLALDVDVAGQVAEAQLRQPGPGQPDQDEQCAERDEPLRHGHFPFSQSAAPCPAARPLAKQAVSR